MFKNRLMLLSGLLVVVALVFAACATPEPVEIIKTVVVTEVVEKEGKEVVVEKTVEVVITATPAPEEPTPDPNAPKEGGKGDVLRVAMLSDITTLNIWSATGPVNSSTWNYMVAGAYYNPAAYGISEHRWDYVPAFAADMPSPLEQEGEFWVSTVPLREDAMWSDGSPITAHDWAWTADVVLTLDLQGNWTYEPDYLDHIEAVDDYTAKVIYHTKPGLSIHQYGVLQATVVSKNFWEPKVTPLLERFAAETDGLDPESDEYITINTEIVQELETLDPTGDPSAGSLAFSQWEEGAFAENVVNENYFDYMTEFTEYTNGAVKKVKGDYEWSMGDTSGEVATEYTDGPWFDKIQYSIYSADAAILALDAGEVDYVLTPNGLSQGQIAQLSNNTDIEIVQNPANGFRYMNFNFQQPALYDKVIRQAIDCMIDKQFLTQNLLQGAAIPVKTIVPQSNAYWYKDDVKLFCDGMTAEERLAEATRMLQEAGYTWDTEPTWNPDRGGSAEWGVGLKMPDGTYMPDLRLLAPSAGYDPLRATAGVYIEQWMNQLGIPVEAELVNFNRILEVRSDPDAWDMYILGWGLSTFPDYPCYFLQPGSGWNYGMYDSEAFDAVCNDLFAETEMEAAKELVYELQDILAEDLPYIYLFTTPMADAWNKEAIMFPFTDVPGGIAGGPNGMLNLILSVE